VPLQTALARCLSREPRLQDLPPSYILQLHAALWLRASPRSCCFAVLALLVLSFLSPASTAGAGGLSLVYAPLRALVARPVPAGDYPLLNPSRLQLLSGGQSALRAGIKLCGHLCSPSSRTRTAAILVGVLVHAAPLPRTSARLRPLSYTLCISAFCSIPSPSQPQFHPL
jgi:hypothetical protein